MTYPITPDPSIHTPQQPTKAPASAPRLNSWAHALMQAMFSQFMAAITGGKLNHAGKNAALLAIRDWATTLNNRIEDNYSTINGVASAGNMVISPNFEIVAIQRPGYGTTPPAIEYTTEQAFLGHQSLMFTTNAPTTQGVYLAPTGSQTYFVVHPGDVLSAQIQMMPGPYNVKTAGSVRIYMRWLADGVVIGDAPGATVVNNVGMPDSWQTLKVTGTAPASADSVEIFVAASSNTPDDSVYYLDAAVVREQSLLQRIIDNINNALNGGGAVDGSGVFENIKTIVDNLNEASDTLEGVVAPGNKVLSPNFEIEAIARFPYGSPTLAYSGAQHKLGSQSLRFTTTAGSQGLFLAPTQKSATFSVQPGDQFDAGVFVKAHVANDGSGSVDLVMRWMNGTSIISDVIGTSVSNSDAGFVSDFVEFVVSGTAPANADGLQVFVVADAGTQAGNIYYVDAAHVREKTLVQKVIDNIHAAIDGAGSSTQQKPDTVANKLKAAWAKFVDGLHGHTVGTTTAALPFDVYTAAASVKAAAATAQTTADAATTSVIEVQNTVTVQAKDYSNVAAGSDFETWADINTPIHPWVLTSRFSINTAGIDNDMPGGRGGKAASLKAEHAGASGFAKLNNTPQVQEGEQFYIEFWALRDAYYDGGSLSKFRIGYNDGDIFLDSIPYDAATFTQQFQWVKFSKTITVPAGASYLTFAFYADHTGTNVSTIPSYNSGRPGAPTYTAYAGALGAIYFDDIIIRRVVPPEGVAPLPQDKVADLNANLRALAAFRGDSLIVNGDFENSDIALPSTWTPPLAGASYSATHVRNGTQAGKLDLANPGAGYLGYARWPGTLDPLGSGEMGFIPCTSTDVFYAEAFVYGDPSNSHPYDSAVTHTYPGGIEITVFPYDSSGAIASTAPPGVALGEQSVTGNKVQTSGTWTKISGLFSLPSNVSKFAPAITATDGYGSPGNKWWVDDFSLYRVTEAAQASAAASAAQTTASAASSTASAASSTAAAASAAASTASTNTSTMVDHTVTAFTGETQSGRTLSDALTAMKSAFHLLGTHTSQIQSLQAVKAAASVQGTQTSTSFGDYADQTGTLPGFNITYSGGGTSVIGVTGGVASWVSTNNADRDAKIISTTLTQTDFQSLHGVMTTPPQSATGGGGTPKFHAIGRVNAALDTFVWARAYSTGSWFQYRGEIGCTVNGNETVWASDIPLSWSLDMSVNFGVGTNPRVYQVYSGNNIVWEHTESGTNSTSSNSSTSTVDSVLGNTWKVVGGGGSFTITYQGATTSSISSGASASTVKSALNALGFGSWDVIGGGTNVWYISPSGPNTTVTASGATVAYDSMKRWGAISQIRAGASSPRTSGQLGGCSAADNMPPSVNGSTARMYRTSTGVVFYKGGNNEAAVPDSFFDHVAYESLDVDADTIKGTFKVLIAKPYSIVGRVRLNAAISSLCHLILQVSTNNGSSWTTVQYGDSITPSGSSGNGISGKWVQYLNEGDMVRLATVRGGIDGDYLTGEADGVETYFGIVGH